ncbi:TOBE domain-containing protein [Ignatzschineria sp. LJL83]
MTRSISARNQFLGKVSAIFEGSVNNEIIITLETGDEIVTVITKQSSQAMKIALDREVLAIIKAPSMILAKPNSGFLFSARNQFFGTIVNITKGAVNSSVGFDTAKGLRLTAIITNDSLDEMQFTVGSEVLGLMKASNIILATKEN